MTPPHGTPPGNVPSPVDLRAALALLGDQQPAVARAARERVLAHGDAARALLQTAAEDACVRTRVRARACLRTLDVRASLRAFAALDLERGGRREAMPLLEGAVLLSHMTRTFAPAAAELATWFRAEAEFLRARFLGRSLPTCARILAEHLAGELGFRGGDASCIELDHVLLDRVVEHRIGIPVAVSLVYLLVARWAGLSVAGVALPDHFLVRLHGVRPVLVDPFHGGRTVTKADCTRYLRSNGHDQVAEHLRDLADREVLKHYLQSLRRAAAYRRGLDAQQSLGDALHHLEAS